MSRTDPRPRDGQGRSLYTAGAFAVVCDERGQVLLGRRRDLGIWTLPGGAVESDESPWEAVVRETREETGLDVEMVRLAAVDWKRTAGDVVFVFECRIVGGSPAPSDETSEVAFFPRADLPTLLPARIVQRVEVVLSRSAIRLVDTP